MTGTYQQQWRRKHHLAWETAHGRPVPPGFRVIFRDGNKRNFEPANLELATREEISVAAFANYQALPESLRRTIRLHRELEKGIELRIRGEAGTTHNPRSKPKHVAQRRWTREMDATFRREYPQAQLDDLAQNLGVTIRALRNRAKRLGVRRSPEVMLAAARAKAAIEKAPYLAGAS